MRKQKNILIIIIIFLSILLSNYQVFAVDFSTGLKELQFSENYKKYMELSDEEKQKAIMPRMYNIQKNKRTVTNPFRLAKMLGSSSSSSYSLWDVIPENLVVRNQKQTNTCWAFASLAVLESNLALKDKLYQKPTMVYDFSERHIEYATSRTFSDGINENGFNREIGSGGGWYLYIPYLTNGTGAIAEAEMPFENNEEKISLSNLENKTVITQVNDIVMFPSYSSTDDTATIRQQMKNYIKNYGAIFAGIDGRSYNEKTWAFYSSDGNAANHAIAIIGWDDDYSTENFVEGNRPENNGAWIIKNSSFGTEIRYTLEEMKEMIRNQNPDMDASQITDDMAKETFASWGYTIENDEAFIKFGDENGFMYVSYEDAIIYLDLAGIMDAQAELTYENIYQYDQFGGMLDVPLPYSKIYLATKFDKKTLGKEYLTQVSIMASETYTCKVYVNPKGTSKAMSDLQQVQLKSGETETFDAGYHTIEFLNPIEITGDSFVVVLEIQGTQEGQVSAMVEFNSKDYAEINESYANNDYEALFDYVEVESEKCFWTYEEALNNGEWCDTAEMDTISNGKYPKSDTTIKAFTTSKVLEGIEIETEPTKKTYIENQDFDKTGMVVKEKWANGDSIEITDYTIVDGKNLSLGQTNVTISYKGFTVTQRIEVVKNTVESIRITTAPKITEYYAGDDFDATDMIVEATYKDGTTKNVTDYTIKDGVNLKNGQSTVTISYEGKTTTQEIIVKANKVVKLEVISNAAKLNYVVGQDFNAQGLIIKATYESGMEKELSDSDYTIKDGTDLKENQTTVTIEFEGQTVTQSITVVVKTVTSISVKNKPLKTEYLQSREDLELKGGIIKISYNDGTEEEMPMTSKEIIVSGFNNEEPGIETITLTYKGKTTQFNINVKELEKPTNSNLDNIQGNVKRVRAYYFTDKTKKEYVVLNVKISDIVEATGNEKMEYYYYLSQNPKEENIINWIKIEQLDFEINTLGISNYDELVKADKIYLYVKEVATRNDMKSEKITNALTLDIKNMNIEEYVDGVKKADVNSDTITDSTPGKEKDDTLAPNIIPNAGKNILILFLVLAIISLSILSYLRYKDIEIK